MGWVPLVLQPSFIPLNLCWVLAWVGDRFCTAGQHLSIRLSLELHGWWTTLCSSALSSSHHLTDLHRKPGWPDLPPQLVARGEMRELTSGPLTVAQPAKAARVIWFLSFVDWVPAHKSGLSREILHGELSPLALQSHCLPRVTAAGGANTHRSVGTSPGWSSFPVPEKRDLLKKIWVERKNGRWRQSYGWLVN